MATLEQIKSLRLMIGEVVPEGGSESDTLFLDTQLGEWIDSSPNLERAAYEGWRAKAAEFASLVNVTDGASSREMGALLDNARAMITLYSKSSSGPTEGRARVGRIVRR